MITTRVQLPRKFWTESKSNEEFKQRVNDYMRKLYPTYRVIEIKRHYARCES